MFIFILGTIYPIRFYLARKTAMRPRSMKVCGWMVYKPSAAFKQYLRPSLNQDVIFVMMMKRHILWFLKLEKLRNVPKMRFLKKIGRVERQVICGREPGASIQGHFNFTKSWNDYRDMADGDGVCPYSRTRDVNILILRNILFWGRLRKKMLVWVLWVLWVTILLLGWLVRLCHGGQFAT